MRRKISLLTLVFPVVIFVSCSGSAHMAQNGAGSLYPSWYGEQPVVSTDSVFYAYATAIDDDSAGAVSKAVEWAKTELQSSVAYSLENMRQQAIEESPEAESLKAASFLRALGKIDGIISELVIAVNTDVKTVEGFESYRSFAAVKLPKKELIARIGEELKVHQEAWQTLKASLKW